MAKQLNKLINIIETAIAEFQKKVPGIQTRIFDDLQEQMHQLQTSNGKVLANVSNLKTIGKIKMRLQKLILGDDYVKEIKKFIKAFEDVSIFHNEYFASFNETFSVSKTLPIIQELAIEATINSLTEAGIGANIVDPILKVLRTNITTGGSISALNNQLRNNILTNDTGDGSLERYSKQITTDALNQYSAQYNQAIASDLKLEWYMYVGSNLTTTRTFCEAMTKVKYIHISQFPQVIKGFIGDIRVPINDKTGLPGGMIPGTNATNLTVYRGGYNCGHQLVAVDDLAVPAANKAAILLTPEYQAWKKAA